MGYQECTIQKHWQHWAQRTQDEDRQNTKIQHNTEKQKKLKISATRTPPKTGS